MTTQKDRIEAAIRHIKTSVDIDPWAMELAVEALKAQIATDTNVGSKYEYHYDHTDCIWYRPEARNRCPTTCAQYRDGWNDAMNYIFRDGKGYRPYRRDKQYGE
jgi:hypothetical protein